MAKQQLCVAMGRLRQGRGGIVELVSDPGMGKTRHLADLLTKARAADLRVVSGRCAQDGPDVVVEIARVLGESSSRPADLARALLRSTEDTVVVIDDFHWAGDAATELVQLLASRSIEVPLLVVIAYRPRQASPRLRGALSYGKEIGTVERVELGPLSVGESARLLGTPVHDPRTGELHEQAGGNPRYLLALAAPDGEHTAALLEERGALSRLEALAVDVAAVLGDGMDVASIAAVAEVPHEQACAATGVLLRRDLLRRVGRTRTLAFRHPVLRELYYADIDICWRAAAHRRAAAALSARGATRAEIAAHIERAPGGPSPDDLPVIVGAAHDAGDPQQALHWLEIALRLTAPDDESRVDLLLALGRALGEAGHLARSRDVLHEVRRLVPDDRWSVRAEALATGALTECLLGHGKEAANLIATGLATIPRDPPPAAVRLVVTHGVLAALEGVPLLPGVFDLAVDLARANGDPVGEAGALAVRGFGRAAGHAVAAATGDIEAAASIVDGLTDPQLLANPECVIMLASTEAFVGRYRDARRHAGRAIAVMRRGGRRHVLPILLNSMSNTCRRLGDMEAAQLASAESALIAESIDAGRIRGLALALRAMSLAWMLPPGSRDAIALGEEAVAAVPRGSSPWSATAAIALAQAALLGDDPRRCMSVILDVGDGPDLAGIPDVLRPWCYELLTAAAAATDLPAADWAARTSAAVDQLGMPYQRAYAVAAQAHALRAGGDYAGAAERYQQAAELSRAADLVCAQATSLAAAARCLTDLGLPDEALPHLVLARELARRSSAQRIIHDIDAHQTPMAQRPHPALSQLTRREQEIASIVGTGRKTRDIATHLAISPRTVDVHLTRIYRKLNITTRAELARLMGKIG